MAAIRGVIPVLVARLTSAPVEINSLATSKCPNVHARNNGVNPVQHWWFKSAPAAINSLTVDVWPSCAATEIRKRIISGERALGEVGGRHTYL